MNYVLLYIACGFMGLTLILAQWRSLSIRRRNSDDDAVAAGALLAVAFLIAAIVSI